MALHRLIALVVLTSCLPENLVKGQSSLALEEQYNWLIRRVVAPTSRWGNGEAPGGCENGCEKENYLRIPGTADPRKAKTLKILVIMESSCPVSYNMDQETLCMNYKAYRSFNKCLNFDLPFSKFTTSETHREVSGYYKSGYSAMFRRVMPNMLRRGWQRYHLTSWDDDKFNAAKTSKLPSLWRDVDTADILIVTINQFRQLVDVFPKKRYILIATNDAATISTGTRCDLDDQRILSLLQHTSLNPLSENNLLLKGNRRHFVWFPVNETFDSLIPKHKRVPSLSAAVLGKVKLLIPQILRWKYPLDCGGRGAFTMLQKSFHTDFRKYSLGFVKRVGNQTIEQPRQERLSEVFIPFTHRKYDITYIGVTASGSDRELYGVNEHRMMAINAMKSIKTRHPHLNVYVGLWKMSYPHFIEVLKDTKIFISPFGLGEFSGKDYEAILAGCVLVKPAAHKLASYPNIYDQQYAVNTLIDFSDLEDRVMPYLESEFRARTRIDHSLKLLQKYADLERWSGDLEEHLLESAAKTVEFDPRGCTSSAPWMYDDEGHPLTYEQLKEVASSRVAAGLPPHSISVVSADALLADLNEDGSQEGNGEDFPYDDEDTLHHVRFVDQYALDLLTEHEQNSPARLGHPGLSLHIRINGGNSTGRTDRPHHLSYYHSPRAGYSLTPRLPAEVNGTPRTAHGHGFHPHAHRHSIHAEGVDKQSEKV